LQMISWARSRFLDWKIPHKLCIVPTSLVTWLFK
jgi:hypothetical protein